MAVYFTQVYLQLCRLTFFYSADFYILPILNLTSLSLLLVLNSTGRVVLLQCQTRELREARWLRTGAGKWVVYVCACVCDCMRVFVCWC